MHHPRVDIFSKIHVAIDKSTWSNLNTITSTSMTKKEEGESLWPLNTLQYNQSICVIDWVKWYQKDAKQELYV